MTCISIQSADTGPPPRVEIVPSRHEDLTGQLARLVATLAHARDRAAARADTAALTALVAHARAELDGADEKLLQLDPHRQRSAFRQAGRIRRQLDAIEIRVAAIGAVSSVPPSGPDRQAGVAR